MNAYAVLATLPADLSLLEDVLTALDARWFTIIFLIRAVRVVRAATGCDPTPARRAVQRHFPLSRLAELDRQTLAGWLAKNSGIDFAVAADTAVPPSADPWDAASALDDAWARWSARTLVFLAGGAAEAAVANADLFLAATLTLPASLLRYDPADMTAEEWSEVLLAGCPVGSAGTPVWTIIAGLRALGLGNPHLRTIAARLQQSFKGAGDSRTLDDAWAAVAEAAPDRGPLRLMIVADTAPEAGIQPPPAPPVIRLRAQQLRRYKEALDWLHGVTPFEEIIDGL